MAQDRLLQARDIAVRGFTLRAWVHGDRGPSVLFLHGFLDTGLSFEPIVRALDGSVRSVCLDWRGHGESRPVPEGMSFHQLDHLKDLSQVIDAWPSLGQGFPDRPDLIVAHSLGAVLAFELAATAPTASARYLLLDTIGGFRSTASDQVNAMTKLLETERAGKRPFNTFASLDAAAQRVCLNNPGLSAEGARIMVEGATEQTQDGRFRFKFDTRLRGPNPQRYTEEVWLECARRIEAQMRVLFGEHGLLERAPWLTHRVDACRHGRYEILPGVAHHVHLDAVNAVAQAIREELELY